MKLTLYVLVIVHFIIVIMNVLAVFVLPFKTPWYIACPLMSFIIWMSFSRVADCPLTKLENVLRSKLGMRKIGGFIGHYIVRSIKCRSRTQKLEA